MQHYVIRGGADGVARLDALARVLWPTTHALFQRAGVAQGMRCLDLGCGGGHVTLELARLVGDAGHVVGIDMDSAKLQIARQRAAEQQLRVTFLEGNVDDLTDQEQYDCVYARFLLTHLRQPADLVQRMVGALRPDGVLIVEDIEISGVFAYPRCPALERHVQLYTAVAQRRGGDPDIGPKLPSLLRDAGIEDLQLNVVQPTFLTGEGKAIHRITMENIAAAVVAEGLAVPAEIEAINTALACLEADSATMASLPRIFQVWGCRPAP
jgi:SAM-dependent methyltransferase